MSDVVHAPGLAPAVWGFLGAFIYAGPRLSACLFAARERAVPRWGCVLEFAIALVIGAIGAAAFGPWAARTAGMAEAAELNAIAAMIGLLANPIAPIVIGEGPKMLSNIVTGRFVKALKGDGS